MISGVTHLKFQNVFCLRSTLPPGQGATEDSNAPSSAVESDTGVESDSPIPHGLDNYGMYRGVSAASSSFIPQNHNSYQTISDLHFTRLSNIMPPEPKQGLRQRHGYHESVDEKIFKFSSF